MNLKFDRFTWIVLLGLVALLVVSLLTVNLIGGDELSYLDENSPIAPIHNAFVAQQEGNSSRLREQYSQRVLDDIDQEKSYNPFEESVRINTQTTQRLRILDVEEDGDRARVTVSQDNYSNSGPFGSGSSWSQRRVIEVVLEDGIWKIDQSEFFY